MAVSPIGSVRFPEVYEAVAMKEGDTPKFSVVLVFRPGDEAWLKLDGREKDESTGKEDWIQMIRLRQLIAAANEASQARFNMPLRTKDGPNVYEGKPLVSPFRKGEEKPKHYEPGDIFVRFASEYLPAVVDGAKNPIPRESGIFYAGCLGRVTYKAATFKYMGNHGVNFYLNNAQRTGDGERIASHCDVDEFGEVCQPAGTSANDDIPF